MEISDDRIASLESQAKRSAADVIIERDKVLCGIENKGAEFWRSGAALCWLDGAEPTIRKVM